MLLAGGQPHVVLLTLDTVRADRIGAYGSSVRTPNLDRLAAEGALFRNASTTVPFTLPAHSSMMTGLYPPTHGVRENVGYTVPTSVPTLAEELGAAGYDTAAFVSAFVLDSKWGIGRGFDHYADDFKLDKAGQLNLGAVQRSGPETLAAATDWLAERDPARPFFLWVHLYDAHDPYTPPEPFRSQYPGAPYDGEVAFVDALVGDLRAALEEDGLWNDTLFIATADHGEGLGDHGEAFHGFFVYDTTVRVPLILRLPGERGAGVRVERAVSHVDLRPTVLDATGTEPSGPAQGRSLVPDILGETPLEERPVYAESMYPLLHYGWSPLRVLRGDRYKFIDSTRPELFDLVSDADELVDVLQQERAVSRSMRASLDELRAALDAARQEESQAADLDEDTLRQLQALGYVAGRGEIRDEGDAERADPKDRIRLHQAIMLAQAELGDGELDRAGERLRRAVGEDPGLVDAHQMLGSIALQQERPAEGLEHYAAALALSPEHTASLWGMATSYRRLGRLEDAIPGYRKIQQLLPGDSKAAVALTEVLVDLGRLEEALEEMEAVTQDGGGARLLNRRGELLALLGRVAEAEQVLLSAIERDAELAQPHFNLGVLAEEARRPQVALDRYRRATELYPGHYRAHFNLGRLEGARGAVGRQTERYRQALEANPDFVVGHYHLAKVIMDAGGDLEEAERFARRGLELDPDGAEGPLGYFVLADILNRRGLQQEAAAAAARGQRLLEATRGSG